MPSRCTSLLLCSKPVQQKCPHCFKRFKKQGTLYGLMKPKLPSRNTLVVNCFALESEKESKNDEVTLFGDCPSILDLPINP